MTAEFARGLRVLFSRIIACIVTADGLSLMTRCGIKSARALSTGLLYEEERDSGCYALFCSGFDLSRLIFNSSIIL
ncbi:MAG: hypothetical protein PHQ34_04695 [Methanothrix sp.]|nr:hypothetical protein [Methanothrix sp.]